MDTQMEQLRVRIDYWVYDDGWRSCDQIGPLSVIDQIREKLSSNRRDRIFNDDKTKEYFSYLEGWFCWAYPSSNHEFDDWMSNFCPTAEYDFRFNGGNPMYTVRITDEQEAAMFILKWIDKKAA